LALSPTPETQVRDACAWAEAATVRVKMATAKILKVKRNLIIWVSPVRRGKPQVVLNENFKRSANKHQRLTVHHGDRLSYLGLNHRSVVL